MERADEKMPYLPVVDLIVSVVMLTGEFSKRAGLRNRVGEKRVEARG